MTPDLAKDDILILQTLWEVKALGARRVTVEHLVGRMPDISKTKASERLRRLEAQGLVTATNSDGDELFGLSPLGTAFVRQLQDRQLGDLSRGL